MSEDIDVCENGILGSNNLVDQLRVLVKTFLSLHAECMENMFLCFIF
jgi:hypothetical protein